MIIFPAISNPHFEGRIIPCDRPTGELDGLTLRWAFFELTDPEVPTSAGPFVTVGDFVNENGVPLFRMSIEGLNISDPSTTDQEWFRYVSPGEFHAWLFA